MVKLPSAEAGEERLGGEVARHRAALPAGEFLQEGVDALGTVEVRDVFTHQVDRLRPGEVTFEAVVSRYSIWRSYSSVQVVWFSGVYPSYRCPMYIRVIVEAWLAELIGVVLASPAWPSSIISWLRLPLIMVLVSWKQSPQSGEIDRCDPAQSPVTLKSPIPTWHERILVMDELRYIEADDVESPSDIESRGSTPTSLGSLSSIFLWAMQACRSPSTIDRSPTGRSRLRTD